MAFCGVLLTVCLSSRASDGGNCPARSDDGSGNDSCGLGGTAQATALCASYGAGVPGTCCPGGRGGAHSPGVWRMAWGRSHPGIPLQPYTGVETTGGRFFLRQGQVSGGANGELALTRTSRGLSAVLTVIPNRGSVRDRELDIAVAFEGAGALADWKARWQIPGKEQRERAISVGGPGFHNSQVPLPTPSRPPLFLEIIAPDDPCYAIIVRSLKLVPRRREQVETGVAEIGRGEGP